MKNFLHVSTWIILIGLLLSACSPLLRVDDAIDSPTLEPVPQMTTRPAQVQSVQIQVMQSDPVQVNAVVRGILSESCATLGQSQVQYMPGGTFQIAVNQVSPGDRGCAQVTTPFETMIALNTSGLPEGAYTVIANGVSAVFTLPSVKPAPTTPTTVPTVVVPPAPRGCTDSAAFVSDVTIPDYSLIPSGSAFTKTWRVKNTGTCAWDSGYLVAYISGATMTQQPGYWLVQPGQIVGPGQSVDVRVGMTAPVSPGSYTSYWGLKKVDGAFMPIQGGAHGNSFFVKIRVHDAEEVPSGHIIGSSIDIELEQGSGVACTPDSTYFVNAYIISDGPAVAHYEIGSTAGQISAGYFQTPGSDELKPYIRGTLTFDQADTKHLVLRFVGPYPYPDNIAVFLIVDGGEFHTTAQVSCQ